MEKHEMQLLQLLVHVIVHKRRTSGIEAIIEVKVLIQQFGTIRSALGFSVSR